MNISTKNKLLMLIVFLLLILTVGIGFFAKYSVEKTMLEKQTQNSINSVMLAQLNVIDRFQILFTSKTNEALAIREKMRSLLTFINIIGKEQNDIFSFLEKFPLPDTINLIALDSDFTPVFMKGESTFISEFYKNNDIKNRPLAETMLRVSQTSQFPAAVIHWQNKNKLERFLGAHTYLSSQKLLIGIWIDIDTLEKEHTERLEKSIVELQENFSQIILGDTGFIFVVDKNGQAIISPDNELITSQIQKNEQYLFDKIKKNTHSETNFFEDKINDRDAVFFIEYVKPFDWYIVGAAFIDEIKKPGQSLSFTLIAGILLAMLFILPIAYLFITRLTSPIEGLADYARKLPEQNFFENAEPEAFLLSLSSKNDKDEISRLAQSFIFMDTTLRKRVQELMEVSKSRERMESELQVAREIQMGFLPKETDSYLFELSAGRFLLSASLVPAREVGGDLYDFFMLDDTYLYIVIGDVSDKGVPASLFMSMTMTLIHSTANVYSSPEKIMEILNDNLVRENPKCMFVTLIIGKLNLETGELVYANAGHNLPLLISADTSVHWLEGLSGPIVGVLEDTKYSLLQTTMQINDILFLYTDGLNEAMNAQKEMYSNIAMVNTLTNVTTHTVENILSAMLEDVKNHVKNTPPSDDMTILCVQYTEKHTLRKDEEI